jgi:hypothetical protein
MDKELKKAFIDGYLAGLNNAEYFGEPGYSEWEQHLFDWAGDESSTFSDIPIEYDEIDDE